MIKKAIKYLSILLALLLILSFSACGVEAQKTKAPTQEELFLSAMSEGLNARFADNRAIDNMSFEETKEYFKVLVEYELERLSIYETVSFADKQFDKLAHDYISACKQQLDATNRDDELQMYSDWNTGLLARKDAAMALHDSYGLPLSQEMLDYFNERSNYSLEDFAQDATELLKDNPEEGFEMTIEVGHEGTLIIKAWIDGFSSDAYWASLGNEEDVATYTDELKEIVEGFPQLQDAINQQLVAAGLPKTEIEFHLMNDVNRENTISIIKKDKIVYDSVLGIDMLGVGTNMN